MKLPTKKKLINKRIKIVALIMFVSILLTGCLRAVMYDDSTIVGEAKMREILEALATNDEEKLKAMFSKTALEEAENFDENAKLACEYYTANAVQKLTYKSGDGSEDFKEKSRITSGSYDVETDAGPYRFCITFCDIDESNENNVGVYSLYLIKNSEDTDLGWDYAGDRKDSPGIHVGIKNGLPECAADFKEVIRKLELPADDSKTLDETITKTYKLNELKSFFGDTQPREADLYGKEVTRLTFSEVDAKYPVECLRTDGYSVYKVEEGGYYYVFWEAITAGVELDALEKDGVTVKFVAHLNSLPTVEDFSTLTKRVSTAEDVAKIEPAIELVDYGERYVLSYSVLADGSIMEVMYMKGDNLHSRKDLVVTDILVSDAPIFSSFQYVMPKDLP